MVFQKTLGSAVIFKNKVGHSCRLTSTFTLSFRYLLILLPSPSQLHRPLRTRPPAATGHTACPSEPGEGAVEGKLPSLRRSSELGEALQRGRAPGGRIHAPLRSPLQTLLINTQHTLASSPQTSGSLPHTHPLCKPRWAWLLHSAGGVSFESKPSSLGLAGPLGVVHSTLHFTSQAPGRCPIIAGDGAEGYSVSSYQTAYRCLNRISDLHANLLTLDDVVWYDMKKIAFFSI